MPRPQLVRALRTGASMPTLAYVSFEDYARHSQRREFWRAFQQFRLKVEAVGRFLMEKEQRKGGRERCLARGKK